MLSKNNSLTITIGAGGSQAVSSTTSPYNVIPATNGGESIVGIDNVNPRAAVAVGGIAGGVVDTSIYSPQQNILTEYSRTTNNSSATIGGNSCKYSTGIPLGGSNGIIISSILINNMNGFFI